MGGSTLLCMFGSRDLQESRDKGLVPQTSKSLLEVSTLLACVIGQDNADFGRPKWSARLFVLFAASSWQGPLSGRYGDVKQSQKPNMQTHVFSMNPGNSAVCML